jgi:hypothetical protein
VTRRFVFSRGAVSVAEAKVEPFDALCAAAPSAIFTSGPPRSRRKAK